MTGPASLLYAVTGPASLLYAVTGPASLLYAVTGAASLLYAVTGPASLLYAVTGATGCYAGEGSHKGSKLTKDWEAGDRGCGMVTMTEMTVVIPLRGVLGEAALPLSLRVLVLQPSPPQIFFFSRYARM